MGDDDIRTLQNELRDYREQVRRARANEAAAIRQSGISSKEAEKARAGLALVSDELASLRREVAKAIASNESLRAEVKQTPEDDTGGISSNRNRASPVRRLEQRLRPAFLTLAGVILTAVVAQFALAAQRQEADVVPDVAQDRVESAEDSVDHAGVRCERGNAGRPDTARRNYEAARELVEARQLFEIPRPLASTPDGADSSGSESTDRGSDLGSDDKAEPDDDGEATTGVCE